MYATFLCCVNEVVVMTKPTQHEIERCADAVFKKLGRGNPQLRKSKNSSYTKFHVTFWDDGKLRLTPWCSDWTDAKDIQTDQTARYVSDCSFSLLTKTPSLQEIKDTLNLYINDSFG